MNTLKIDNLSITINSKILYEDASYIFNDGFYQIVGNNGVGKTSLFNCIYQQLKYQGNIFYNDTDINKIADWRKNYVSYCNQETLFIDNISVTDNVYLLFNNERENIIEILKKYIDVKLKFKKLSGGQQQLVNVICALSKKANVYLLDEPFNNLDDNKVNIIKGMINKKEGIIIIIDHTNTISGKEVLVERRSLI